MTESDAGPPPAPAMAARGTLSSRWLPTTGYYAILALVTTALAVPAVGLLHHSLDIPLAYYGDALSGGAQFKDVLERGWYEFNPDLGAPWGQHFHDFPLADNLHLMVAHVFGYFTDQWPVAFNLYYLATFPLAALAAAWFMRLVGGSRTAAFGVGILYAFAPYHSYRSEGNLYLSAYYPVPLAAGLIYLVLAGRPLWARKASSNARNPLSWLTARTIWTILIVALMGTASSYYSVFTIIFLVFAGLVSAVTNRRWRPAFGVVVAVGALAATMLANMAPDLLYSLGKPTNYAGFSRMAQETELYSFKLSSLLLPVPWERITPLAQFRQRYDADFPLPSELPMLGLIAAAGLLFLIAVMFVSPLVRLRGSGDGSVFWRTQRQLAVLSVFGVIVGTVGGLSTLFALVVSDNIRGWNRIAIFLSLFALASVGLLFDRATGWVGRRVRMQRRPWLPAAGAALACLVLVGFGLFDQLPPVQRAQITSDTAAWNSDQNYIDAIQAQVPPNTMIFQLPYLAFPESGGILALADSDPLRMYLHSTDLRWSYGGIKGRPLADWAESVANDPTQRMLVEIGAAKFGGLHVDRAGYSATADEALENDLRTILDVSPVVSPDGRFSFWNLQKFDRALTGRYPTGELDTIGSHAVAHPVSYWQASFSAPQIIAGKAVFPSLSADPTLYIDNPRSSPTRVVLSLGLTSARHMSNAVIRWPDGLVQQVSLGAGDIQFSREIDVPVGRSALTFAPGAGASEIPVARNRTTDEPVPTSDFEISDPVVADPVLQSFPL